MGSLVILEDGPEMILTTLLSIFKILLFSPFQSFLNSISDSQEMYELSEKARNRFQME